MSLFRFCGMDASAREARLAAFGAARDCSTRWLRNWGIQAANELTHAQIEEHITTRGREVMRQMLHGHLNLRSMRDAAR